ncbi:hypothetical protein AAG570_003128 [Ranatra chinensis]|uniref:Ribosomal protein eL8/eL30/eS12/Gadd45 domain-containing protein n=1 Tax=Ranatra chinensis TaxID=642074 RepID=A0ABD0YI95_9HEMI
MSDERWRSRKPAQGGEPKVNFRIALAGKGRVKYKSKLRLDTQFAPKEQHTINFKAAVTKNQIWKSITSEEAWPELGSRCHANNSRNDKRSTKETLQPSSTKSAWSALEDTPNSNVNIKVEQESEIVHEGEQQNKSEDSHPDFPSLQDSLGKKKHPKQIQIEYPKTKDEVSSPVKCDSKTGKKLKAKKSMIKPRPTDPININVLEVIQLAAAKKLKTKEVRAVDKVTNRLRCGNILDSSQPLRKRGKVRLVPKKKPVSRIKNAIVLARMVRQQKNVQCGSTDSDSAAASLQGKLENANIELKKEFERVKCIFRIGDGKKIKETYDDTEQHMEDAKNQIHSRKFRIYCNNIVSKVLEDCTHKLIKVLHTYQDRVYKTEPINFKKKRRYVCGFKETIKYLQFGELKLVIIATDLEITKGEPMLNMIQEVVKMADQSNVPCAFTGIAKDLGYWTLKKGRISIIGILNYMGAEEVFKDVIFHLDKAKSDYKEKLGLEEQALKCDDDKKNTSESKAIEELIQEAMLLKLSGKDGKAKPLSPRVDSDCVSDLARRSGPIPRGRLFPWDSLSSTSSPEMVHPWPRNAVPEKGVPHSRLTYSVYG